MTMPAEPEETESHGEFSGESPEPYQSRTAAFGQGSVHSSPGLEQDEEKDDQGPKSFTANGANMQYARSGNAVADDNQSRILVGGNGMAMLPSLNGISATSYEQKRPYLSTNISSGPTG
jgi:hypothetical protein